MSTKYRDFRPCTIALKCLHIHTYVHTYVNVKNYKMYRLGGLCLILASNGSGM